VVVVALPFDGIDVLGLLVGPDLLVGADELQHRIEPLIGKGVIGRGVIRQEPLIDVRHSLL